MDLNLTPDLGRIYFQEDTSPSHSPVRGVRGERWRGLGGQLGLRIRVGDQRKRAAKVGETQQWPPSAISQPIALDPMVQQAATVRWLFTDISCSIREG